MPSLTTPEKHLDYQRSIGRLPKTQAPDILILFFSESLMNEILSEMRTQRCEGFFNYVTYLKDYPHVAVAHFGMGAPITMARADLMRA